MLKHFIINIFTRIAKRRRFWKFASFSEIGELYAVRVMRTIAFYVGASFISVFMLKSGYTVLDVSIFWSCYYAFKVLAIMPLAQVIANIGPSKSIILSNFLYVPSIISFIFLPEFGIYVLVVSGLLQAVSAALYDMGYMVSFSRVKNTDKAGSQVALMNIVEKVAKGISPLIGGLVAMFFDPRASIVVSAAFFILAAWPLMHTKDSMKTGFKVSLRDFDWRAAKNGLVAQIPVGFDLYASTTAWTVFLASLIFTATSNDEIYAQIGALTSLILLVSLVSTHAYGKLIDKKAGGQLLFWTAFGNVVANVFRALVRTPAMAIGTNAAKEVMVTGYSMAFMRGIFDEADRSGRRVTYVGLSNLLLNIGSLFAALTLTGAVVLFSVLDGFTAFYFVAAAVVSFIMFAKFRLYR